jgi:hypothetical protein
LSLLRHETHAIASTVPIMPPWKLMPPSHSFTSSPGSANMRGA